MKCPICGNEMEKGGIIIGESRYMDTPSWYPESELKKRWLNTFRREGERVISQPDEYRFLSGENHYEAWLCQNCNKVVAVFDVKPQE